MCHCLQLSKNKIFMLHGIVRGEAIAKLPGGINRPCLGGQEGRGAEPSLHKVSHPLPHRCHLPPSISPKASILSLNMSPTRSHSPSLSPSPSHCLARLLQNLPPGSQATRPPPRPDPTPARGVQHRDGHRDGPVGGRVATDFSECLWSLLV